MIYVQLDVNYPDDEKIVRAGEKAELLYVRALCYAQRVLSDGFVPDVQLPRFMLTDVQRRARKLVEVGLWERDDARDGYVITAYLKRNRSAIEVRERTEAKAEAGREASHRRWHVQEGKYSPTCPYCTDGQNGHGSTHRSPNGSTDRSTDRSTQCTTASASTDQQHQQPPARGRKRSGHRQVGGVDVEDRIGGACLRLAEAEADRLADSIPYRPGWIRSRVRKLKAMHGADLATLVADHPELTAEQLARALNGDHSVIRAPAPTFCGECDHGWVPVPKDDGTTAVARCECQA